MIPRPTILLLLGLWVLTAVRSAQKQFADDEDLEGSIQVGPTEDAIIPRTRRGYSLLLPENANLVVLLSPWDDTAERTTESCL